MSRGNPSNPLTYQSIINREFVDFLRAGKISKKTIENYRADLHHFFRWVESTLEYSGELTLDNLSGGQIADYKSTLESEGTPRASINRRLSALRSFFKFAHAHGHIRHNPIKTIENMKKIDSPPQDFLNDYESHLLSQGASLRTVREYRSDVTDYLDWLALQKI